jgi:DNA-directed RNA polymerase II subunit RPB1
VTTAQRIVNNWLITNSFTVGAADCVPDEDLERNIKEQIVEINALYYNILNKYRNEETIVKENLHQRGKRVIDSFEYSINVNLNNRLSAIQKIVSEKVSPYLNCIYKMITAKSKGSETNLTQIMFCLGNQNVDGRRCPLGFSRRALPHFSKDDNSP